MILLEKIAFAAIFILFLWRCFKIKDFFINEKIRFSEVQVISDSGEKLGKMSTKSALDLAYSKNLDLVLVSSNRDNPVCKMMDYNKYKYDMTKRAKEAKKKQKIVEIKEVRLSPKIDTHDLEVKSKMANKFITAGNKVKVSMRFRGREMNFMNQGKEVMNNFKDMIENCQVEKESKKEGRNLVMFLAPKQNK